MTASGSGSAASEVRGDGVSGLGGAVAPGTVGSAQQGGAPDVAEVAQVGQQAYPAYVDLLQQPWWWCSWGALLAALGWRVPSWTWPPTLPKLIGFLACAVGFALLAIPVRDRPIAPSARYYHVLFAHRNGVVAAGFVVLAATHAPGAWEPAVDAAALAAYLLMLDAFAAPPAAFRRLASPGVLATLTLLVAASATLVELPGADQTARQVIGIAGAAVALAAGLWAGFGVARRR
jgi:hypothetical protein